LRLDSLEAVLKGGEDGKVGSGGGKKAVAAAARIDNEIAMPPKKGRVAGRPAGPGSSSASVAAIRL
jgi:hypothetical protein